MDCKLIIMSIKNLSVNAGICKLIKGNKKPEILSAVIENRGYKPSHYSCVRYKVLGFAK